MKRKLAIEIDCGDKTCDGCRFRCNWVTAEGAFKPACSHFGKPRENDMRLPECLAAEIPDCIDPATVKLLQAALGKNENPLTSEEVDVILKQIEY